MGADACLVVNPRRRALASIAILLLAVALVGIVITAMGWEAVGPAALPLSANAPTNGVDTGNFEVHGTHYVAVLMGTPGNWSATIVHSSGSGGRIAPLEGADSHVDARGALVVSMGDSTNLTLRAYRESWVGTWRLDPVVLQFNPTK